jgi:hypothetical protein
LTSRPVRSNSATWPSSRFRRIDIAETRDAATVADTSGPSGRAGLVGLPTRRSQPPQLGDDLFQPLALDQLHGVEADVSIPTHLEDRHDMGVVQPGRRLRLAAEPLLGLWVVDQMTGEDLQGHPAAQGHLLGLVDHPHPAPADLAQDPVVADLAKVRGDRWWRRGHLGPSTAVDLLDLD